MRVFIAVEFTSMVKDYLTDVQNVVKLGCKKGNFTLYNNFHLTLRFIGDTNQRGIDQLCDLIDVVTEHQPPFSIKLSDLGSFTKGRKKILWVGIHEGKDQLKKLVNHIESHIEEFGFEKEKRNYKPHVTIARQVELSKSKLTVINQVPIYQEEIPVKAISLMHSHRENGELVYTPIYRSQFNIN